MQLIVKAVLWLHVSLYRLTNGRIGGRFIAGSPILLLTTTITGRRTGKRRTGAVAYVSLAGIPYGRQAATGSRD